MDSLPHSLLLDILIRLDDSADIARCRVASKAFNTIFPAIRSINIQWPGYNYPPSRFSSSDPPISQVMEPLKKVFLNLISKMETVESVTIGYKEQRCFSDSFKSYFTSDLFTKEWVPMVSGTLKSLSVSDRFDWDRNSRNFLSLISAYCYNLVHLKLERVWLHVDTMNPMPMLTSLTLKSVGVTDEELNKVIKCVPNLQVLKMLNVHGPKDIMIELLNLKTFVYDTYEDLRCITIVTPKLTTLTIKCFDLTALLVEAPMLSHFHLGPRSLETSKKCGNLKTLWLDSLCVCYLLPKLQIMRKVREVTLELRNEAPRDGRDSKLTIWKIFTVFPGVRSLCIKQRAWSELEACLNWEDWEISDRGGGLKTLCAYLMLVDPLLTFRSVACVLDQCVNLSEVSLLIHGDVDDTVSENFICKCVSRWPLLKWRWGIWTNKYEWEDAWIIKVSSN